ncbi:hypothetical protein ABZ690_00860 [Streptomyces sp. NPDC006967]|uniref:hypothetical protein n=1 Tax=Streptomyces sp. NPDC006967 TaxID=3156906 RepID=UPI0033E169BC
MADNVNPLRRTGGGYPGRPALDAADARLRAQLRRLTRDPDTEHQAAAITARAARALEELTRAAYQAEEESPRARARARRQQQRLAGLFTRAGRPVPAALDTPEPDHDRG